MNEPNLLGRLLIQLLSRSQDNESIDLFALAKGAGASQFEALGGLAQLEQSGLVDANRLRLTLSGLALAAALSLDQKVRRGERAEPERKSSRLASRARHAA